MSGKYLHSTCVLDTHFISHAWAQNSQIQSEVWILEFLGFSSGENKKEKEKQEKRGAHYKKKIEGNLFKKYWKPERKVKKPSVDRGRSLFFKKNSFLGKTWLIRHINLMKRWQQCFQELYVIFVVPCNQRERDGKYFEFHWMNMSKCWHLFDFLTINMCFFVVNTFVALNWNFCLKIAWEEWRWNIFCAKGRGRNASWVIEK